MLSSVAERHYGVTCRALYDEKEDQGRKKTWDSYEGIYRVEKMTWFINKASLSRI